MTKIKPKKPTLKLTYDMRREQGVDSLPVLD